jgi:hypothetical protein
VTACLAFVLVLGAAPADAAPSPASAPASPVAPAASPALDFDFLPPATQLPPVTLSPDLAGEVDKRRALLTYHQAAGLGTLVFMTATTIFGALDYHERYGGGGGSRRWVWPHRIGAGITTLEFAAAGTLALLAPKPYEKDVEGRGFSPGTVHRGATFLAALGMATQLGLGIATAQREGSHDTRSLAKAHAIAGYTTLGLVAIAASAWLF